MMKKKATVHYVDNEKFLQVLVEYKKDVKKAKRNKEPKPKIPNYVGECFLKIAEHLSYRPNFMNYSFRDEMIADAVENCLMYFENFDPEKSSNPFAYFTQIVFYAFLRRISKEKKQQYVKYKSLENSRIFDDLVSEDMETLLSQNSTKFLKPSEIYDNMSEFIENFEQTRKIKKVKNNKVKGVEEFYEGENYG
jgi:hypothetical protein